MGSTSFLSCSAFFVLKRMLYSSGPRPLSASRFNSLGCSSCKKVRFLSTLIVTVHRTQFAVPQHMPRYYWNRRHVSFARRWMRRRARLVTCALSTTVQTASACLPNIRIFRTCADLTLQMVDYCPKGAPTSLHATLQRTNHTIVWLLHGFRIRDALSYVSSHIQRARLD